MLKILSIAAAAAMLATSAYAMECTKAEMDKMQAEVKATTDKPKQDAAMKEMTMAEDMMKKNDMKACMTHMENASKAIGKKM